MNPVDPELAWDGHASVTPNTPVYLYRCGSKKYYRLSPKGAEAGRIKLAEELRKPVSEVVILNGGHII